MDTFDYYNWLILPLIIFFSRVTDVTLGTLRHVFVSRGFKNLAPLLGFFEVLLWIMVAKQIMTSANSWQHYIAWAGGFATGNYIGLRLEEKLALGLQIIQIITDSNSDELMKQLSAANHGATIVDGHGATGPVKIIFTIARRKQVKKIVQLVEQCNPNAFYSIEDIRNTKNGIFTQGNSSSMFGMRNIGKMK
ncbi:MAG: DUF2179 domain-containing protein [Bacteroidetes bacterium]|nr:DUF2179 domain-containing protein [Bacteroidota bacterium]